MMLRAIRQFFEKLMSSRDSRSPAATLHVTRHAGESAEQHQSSSVPVAKRSWFTEHAGVLTRSSVALAIVIFVMIDVGIRSTYSSWHPDRFCSPNRSWAWWAVQDLEKQNRTPDILLMGSSLMLSVIHDGDATYLNKTQDAVYHHRSYYLEHLMQKKLNQDVRTFSMAIGGQMASDAYAIASTLFNRKQKPEVIVYGIAPRDFIDCMFLDPSSTETYRLMSRAGNAELKRLAGHKSMWNCMDDTLQYACFIYDRRVDFVDMGQRWSRALLSAVSGIRDGGALKSSSTLRAEVMPGLPEDTPPNAWLVGPYDPRNTPFRDNLTEYKRRYSLFRPSVYETQIGFFERFLRYCHDNGIQVVLVNMPLTPENISILPDGLYTRYLSDVSKLAARYQARLEDFNEPGLFSHSCFADSVHVNGYGAERFVELLSDRLINCKDGAIHRSPMAISVK